MSAAPTLFRKRVSGVAFYMHRCKACKAARRVHWTHEYTAIGGYYAQKVDHKWEPGASVTVLPSWGRLDCPAIACRCGGAMPGKRMTHAHNPDVPCDSRCTSARGHNCECSCNGANHGRDYDADNNPKQHNDL